MNKWARLPYSLQMALSFNWIGLSTTNARIGVRIPVGSQNKYIHMPLSFNWIGHGSSKARIGVRVPVGVQMESKTVRVLSPPAKRVDR